MDQVLQHIQTADDVTRGGLVLGFSRTDVMAAIW